MTIITDQLHYDKKVHIIPLVKRKENVNHKLSFLQVTGICI